MAVAAWKSKTKRNEARNKAKARTGKFKPSRLPTVFDLLGREDKRKALWFTNNAVQSTISIGVFGLSS
jgi:hypothetical protein